MLRFRRDIGKNSALGVLFAGREGDDYHNRSGGLDGFFRLGETDTIEFQYLRSNTRYPDAVAGAFDQSAGSFEGDAFRINYDHEARDWLWFASYRSLDPGFRADSGFVSQVDLERATGTVIRRFRGAEGDWWSQVDIGLFAERSEDHGGRLTEEGIDFFANVRGPLQSFTEISLESNKEFFGGVLYEGMNRVQFYGEFQPSGAVELSLFSDQGDTVDFSNNQPADLTLVNPAVEAKIGRHVNIKLDHTLQTLDVEGGRPSRIGPSSSNWATLGSFDVPAGHPIPRVVDPGRQLDPVGTARLGCLYRALFEERFGDAIRVLARPRVQIRSNEPGMGGEPVLNSF